MDRSERQPSAASGMGSALGGFAGGFAGGSIGSAFGSSYGERARRYDQDESEE
jgi:hypothetical protein